MIGNIVKRYICEQCEKRKAVLQCRCCTGDEDPFLYCVECSADMHKGRKARHEVTNLVDIDGVKLELNESVVDLQKPKEDEEMVIKQCSERKRDLKLSFENMRRMLYKREEELMVQLDAIGSYHLLRLKEKHSGISMKIASANNLIQEVKSTSDTNIIEKAPMLQNKLHKRNDMLQHHLNEKAPVIGIVPDCTYINHSIMRFTLLDNEDWGEGYKTVVYSCISAHCSCIDAHGRFWLYEIISRPEIEIQIDLLARSLTTAISCDKLLPKVEIKEGLLCSAQSSVDGQWHRAYVEKVNANSRDKGAVVLFMDYGSIEIVPHERIAVLPEKFTKYPFRCRRCVFATDGTVGIDWKTNREAKWAYSDAVRNQNLSLSVLKKVKLFNDKGNDIFDMVSKVATYPKEDIRYKNGAGLAPVSIVLGNHTHKPPQEILPQERAIPQPPLKVIPSDVFSMAMEGTSLDAPVTSDQDVGGAKDEGDKAKADTVTVENEAEGGHGSDRDEADLVEAETKADAVDTETETDVVETEADVENETGIEDETEADTVSDGDIVREDRVVDEEDKMTDEGGMMPDKMSDFDGPDSEKDKMSDDHDKMSDGHETISNGDDKVKDDLATLSTTPLDNATPPDNSTSEDEDNTLCDVVTPQGGADDIHDKPHPPDMSQDDESQNRVSQINEPHPHQVTSDSDKPHSSQINIPHKDTHTSSLNSSPSISTQHSDDLISHTLSEPSPHVMQDSESDIHTTASEIEHESDADQDTRQPKRKKTLNRVTIDVSESDTPTEVEEPVRPSKLTLDLHDVTDDVIMDHTAQDVVPPIHPSVVPDAELSVVVNSSLTKEGIFWGQLVLGTSEEQLYDALSEKLQAHAASKGEYTPIFFTAGDLCMAVFSEDGDWYRGIVAKEHSKESLEVIFVDYGNSDIVPIHNIMALKSNFRLLPYNAIQCCLTTEDVEFTKQNCVAFEELLSSNDPISVTVLYIEDDVVYVKATLPNGKDLYHEVTGSKSRTLSFDMETADNEGLTWAEQMDSLQSPSAVRRDKVFFSDSEVFKRRKSNSSTPNTRQNLVSTSGDKPSGVNDKKGVTKPVETPENVKPSKSPPYSSTTRPSFDTTSVNKFLGFAVDKPVLFDPRPDTKPVGRGKSYLDKAGKGVKTGRKAPAGAREPADRSSPVEDWGSPSYRDDRGGSKRRHKKDKGGVPFKPWGGRRYHQDMTYDTLYVRNFPFGTTSRQVLELFKEYGPVIDVRAPRNSTTVYYVDMRRSDCEKAFKILKSRDLPSHDGSTFKVKIDILKSHTP